MKSLDLNKYSVQAMTAEEIRKTEGGSLLSIAIEIIKNGFALFI